MVHVDEMAKSLWILSMDAGAMKAFAWCLIVVGVVSAVAAFIIATRTVGLAPWPVFALGLCLTGLGIVLLAIWRPENSD